VICHYITLSVCSPYDQNNILKLSQALEGYSLLCWAKQKIGKNDKEIEK